MISLIVFLTLVGGSLSDNCNWCYYKRPIKVPETAEELLYLCQKEKPCVICLEKAKESSGKEKDADEIRETSRTFNYLNTTCKEDNPAFKAIFNNLQCGVSVLKNMLYGKICLRPPTEGFFESASDAVYGQIRQDFGKKEFFSECLKWSLMDTKCFAITLGYHCGREMRDAFEAVTSYATFFPPLDEPCPKEYLDRVQPVYEVYEAALLKDLIRKDDELLRRILPKLTVTVNFDRKLNQVYVSDPHVTLTSELEVQPKMVH